MAETQQLLDEIVQTDEIQRYRTAYEKAKEANQVTDQNKFSFAYCLVRSKAKSDVRTGLTLLRELYDATRNDNAKRDYLYYLALGNARLGEYEVALKFLDGILHVQPGNHQAKNLREEISRRMTREGCMFKFDSNKLSDYHRLFRFRCWNGYCDWCRCIACRR